MINTQTFSNDLFAKTDVPRSVRSMTLDLVTSTAGFALGFALFGSHFKLGLWHSTLGIAFASVFLIGLPLLAVGRTLVDVVRGRAGTQTDFVLFVGIGYLTNFVLGLLAL